MTARGSYPPLVQFCPVPRDYLQLINLKFEMINYLIKRLSALYIAKCLNTTWPYTFLFYN